MGFSELAKVLGKKEPAKVHVDLRSEIDKITLKGLSSQCFMHNSRSVCVCLFLYVVSLCVCCRP